MNNVKVFPSLIDAERFFEGLGKVPAKMLDKLPWGKYWRVSWNEETDYGY